MAAKKRLTMFDAMDGALSRIGGLTEAAAKANTLPFRLKPHHTTPEIVPLPQPADGPTFDNGLGNALDNATTPAATPSTAHCPSTSTTVSTATSTTPWAATSTTPTDKTAFISGRKAQTLRAVLIGRPEDKACVVRYPDLAEKLKIPYKTLRWVMSSLEKDGFFKRRDFRNGRFQGVELLFDERLCQRFLERQGLASKSSTTPWAAPSTTTSTSTSTSTTHTPYKIERKNLSLSSSRLAATWPRLAQAGFGTEQLDQIVRALEELGKETDRIVVSLDHAEWELAHDAMVDRTGQPVVDPCAWVFQSLARTGYYRRPAGFVSAQEQAVKDAEAEARALLAARRQVEETQFAAWRASLAGEALEEVMAGYPGGPKEIWLKAQWEKRFRKA